MFKAHDSLEEDKVYICTVSSLWYALWGRFMSTRAIQLKASGAIYMATPEMKYYVNLSCF
ncbi:hypothetical protein [uncultured Maribacter sp.]|uniref:hypothetical protein n=1 Tax=uncultured Maribacter sp. TaxID=431308 RepID=UPI0026088E06|nr:hypothetical protein [uncultured Maribacter sp.]